MNYECDVCHTIGTEDDLCGDDWPCPDEECEGICYVLLPEVDRVQQMADDLAAASKKAEGEPAEALKAGALALHGLATAYRTNQLWTVDGSSGSDDAAFLYAILTDIGLEVP